MRLSRALGRKLRRNLAARQVTEAEGAARRRAREPLAGKGAIGPLGKPASSQKKAAPRALQATALWSSRRCIRAPRAADLPAAGLEGQNACGIGVSEAAGLCARGRGWDAHMGRPPRLRAQGRPEPPGAGRRRGKAWTLPRGAFGHAARADELAQLGASQHHLALRIFVVRGGDAVGAHALAERVGVRRQQLLQPHAIEAAAL